MPDTSIFPAMCRRDLVPEDQHTFIQDFLIKGAADGIDAISAPFFYDGENLHSLGGVRFLFRDNGPLMHRSALDQCFPDHLRADAQRIALFLTDTHGVASDLEEVDADYLMFPNAGSYNAMFHIGCTIVAADDPSSRIQSDAHDIIKAPEKLRNRAPMFTLILNDVGSEHARAAQPPKVLDAIDKWLPANGFLPGFAQASDFGVKLCPPTQVDIMSCDRDCIQITHPDEA